MGFEHPGFGQRKLRHLRPCSPLFMEYSDSRVVIKEVLVSFRYFIMLGSVICVCPRAAVNGNATVALTGTVTILIRTDSACVTWQRIVQPPTIIYVVILFLL